MGDDVENLWPPAKNYEYFSGRLEHPFGPTKDGFERSLAAWLSDFSLLVYDSDAALIEEAVRAGGFGESLTLVGFDAPGLSAQLLVAASPTDVVVAFCGSEVTGENRVLNIVLDWLTDAAILLVPLPDGAMVHAGFAAAVDLVWPQLLDAVSAVAAGRRVWFTGHSLGAACATLAAYRYAAAGRAVYALYTFGSPRVGNSLFRDRALFPTWRTVNEVDLVTGLPGFGQRDGLIYRHVGKLRYLNPDGTIARQLPSPLEALGNLADREPFKAVRDHAPIRYSRKLWGGL